MSFNGIPFFGMNMIVESGGLPPFPDFDTTQLYMVGNNDGGGDYFRKVNTSGSLQWEKPVGGAQVYAIDISPYNSIYLGNDILAATGEFWKVDTDGNQIWNREINQIVYSLGVSFESTSNEDYDVWISGFTNSNTQGYLMKYDSNGNQLIHKTLDSQFPFGGIAPAPDGSVYVAGASTNKLAKYDSSGNQIWASTLGGDGLGVAIPLGATYVVQGGLRVSNVVWRKYTSDGTLEYERDMTSSFGYHGRPIFIDEQNGYIYVISESSNQLRKYDEDGTLLMTKSLPCTLCRAYTVISDGGSFIYTTQQQEGLKKWTDVASPVQQWQYDAGVDNSIIAAVLYPTPFRRNESAWV